MEETSGMVTEEGSISQDRQTCNRCRMYRAAQQNHSLHILHTEYLIQGDAVHSPDDFMLIKEIRAQQDHKIRRFKIDAERNTVVLHFHIKLFIELYFLLLYVELFCRPKNKLFGIAKVASFILLCLCVWFQASLFIQNYSNFIFTS